MKLRYVLIVSLLVISIYNVEYFLPNAVIKKIYITSKLTNESRNLIKNKIKSYFLYNNSDHFFSIDLNKLSKFLTNDPQIKTVNITKKWPNYLEIDVVEENILASIGIFFLNEDGLLIEKYINKNNEIPELKAELVEVPQLFKILKMMNNLGIDISMVRSYQLDSWEIITKTGQTINILKNNEDESLDKFSKVYSKYLKKKFIDIKSLDLRYSTSMAIYWKKLVNHPIIPLNIN